MATVSTNIIVAPIISMATPIYNTSSSLESITPHSIIVPSYNTSSELGFSTAYAIGVSYITHDYSI